MNLSWGEFLVAAWGVFAIALLLVGLGYFVADEILDADDPEDRWSR